MTRRVASPWVAWAAVAVSVAACSGPYTRIAAILPSPEAALGPRVTGSACGLLLLNVIPLGVNDRAERAHRDALQHGKATALAEVSVTDRWYWAGIGTVLCADLEGRTVLSSGSSTVVRPPIAESPEPAVPSSPLSRPAAPAPPIAPPTTTAPLPAPFPSSAAPGPATLAVPPEVAAKRTALEKLRELKRLHDEGRFGDRDYEAIRQRVIEGEVGPQR